MKRIYSIKDVKSGAYLTPMVCENHVDATRQFQRATNSDQSIIFEYPEDFELFYLGSFDIISGAITPLATPEFIINALSLKRAKAPIGN
nr:MAG: nonstructural protein [Microviridae sp.]